MAWRTVGEEELKGFQDQSFPTSFSLLKGIALSKQIQFVIFSFRVSVCVCVCVCACVCARMFVYLPERRQKKEGEEVYGKSCALHPGVCPCEGEIFVSPERKVCFLSVLMFQGEGDESNLQMASAVEEHLNPISTRQTQMDHRRISVVEEA